MRFGVGSNVAETLFAASMATVQVPVVLVQAPLQPEKTLPESALAVRVTDVPLVIEALHVAPQFIPAGDDVTVPVPVPVGDLVTERV